MHWKVSCGHIQRRELVTIYRKGLRFMKKIEIIAVMLAWSLVNELLLHSTLPAFAFISRYVYLMKMRRYVGEW